MESDKKPAEIANVSAGFSLRSNFCKVKSMETLTVDRRVKDFLTDAEIEDFLTASRKGTHGPRDFLLALLAYRHGFRVSELINVRMEELDLKTGRLYVRRLKGSLSTEHPIEGDELRAVRAWLRFRARSKFANLPHLFLGERGPMTRQAVNYLFEQIGKRAGLGFKVRPHMLRHSCGYYLANKGFDTRLIQDYLGHQNIHHTVRYTRTASRRFEGLWRK
jgi:type 1 fimbriae regulatory protein FimB